MQTIHILSSRDVISFMFFYPLLALRKRLEDRGCRIKFFSTPMDKLCDADVVLLDNRFFSPLWAHNKPEALGILTKLRQRARHLIWLDVTDSSGATQFQVMPFVDRYLKKQLLRQRKDYLRPFYGARIYTDFYYHRFSLKSENVFSVDPIREADLSKLAVSWNLGLGMIAKDTLFQQMLKFLPMGSWERWPHRFQLKMFSGKDRPLDICFRGSEYYNNQAMAFQRQEIIRRLKSRGVATQPIGRSGYVRELRRTKLCLSPFGAGEICFRDFEIITNGGMLLKPDMSHLETWPDLFQPQQTYVPFRWDFTDFDGQINALLAEPQRIADISRQAQEQYRRCFSSAGEQAFCERFLGLVKPL